ncbi:unnamed protein product, partial [Ectocarpus sp. 12 AP-2014]
GGGGDVDHDPWGRVVSTEVVVGHLGSQQGGGIDHMRKREKRKYNSAAAQRKRESERRGDRPGQNKNGRTSIRDKNKTSETTRSPLQAHVPRPHRSRPDTQKRRQGRQTL